MGGKEKKHYYGGQAVVEGVMMRGIDTWSVAVRRPNEDIYVEVNEVKGLGQKYPLFRKPLFRGVAALGEALSIGFRALTISANQSLEEEEKLTPRQMALSMAFALTLFIGLFIVFPAFVTGISFFNDLPWLLANFLEGVFRILVFLAYLVGISWMKDIRRVFQYHGAEHKTIAAHEAGEQSLTIEAVDKYSTLHVRCGTNFLIIVMLLAVLVYSFFGRPDLWLRILSRIVAIPLIAGLSYEALRLGASKGQNPIVRVLMKPGLWLQKITTKPPEPGQIEVAVRAFEAALPEAERTIIPPMPSPVVRREDEDGTASPAAPSEPGPTPAPES